MPDESSSHIDILPYLHHYPGRKVISTSEFRKFPNISASTHQRMCAEGKNPHSISPMGSKRDERILLIDLACWLVQESSPVIFDPTHKKREPASEAWKEPHSKVDDSSENPDVSHERSNSKKAFGKISTKLALKMSVRRISKN